MHEIGDRPGSTARQLANGALGGAVHFFATAHIYRQCASVPSRCGGGTGRGALHCASLFTLSGLAMRVVRKLVAAAEAHLVIELCDCCAVACVPCPTFEVQQATPYLRIRRERCSVRLSSSPGCAVSHRAWRWRRHDDGGASRLKCNKQHPTCVLSERCSVAELFSGLRGIAPSTEHGGGDDGGGDDGRRSWRWLRRRW
jgi:hypothetical protein